MPKYCIEPGCKNYSAYNYKGSKGKIYCGEHKKENMIGSKTCLECDSTALFGFDIKLYCGTHKKKDMINLKKPTCCYPGCSIQPYFNYPGKKFAIYCDIHKLDTMVNVLSNKCLECGKIPSFGYEKGKALYCGDHKKDNMRNLKNNTCEFEGCVRQPSFNYKGETKYRFCKPHMLKDMVNIRYKKKEKSSTST
jgi:hypothetical protein